MEDATPYLNIPEPPDLKKQLSVREERELRNLKRCLWPTCQYRPDRDVGSPLCWYHTGVVVDRQRDYWRAFNQEKEAKRPKRVLTPVELARTTGQIYYIRLNDVIKIGWSSQLQGRLHDYGAGAVLLAHHPGSRADERDLHRSFRPLLVHGREWYRGDAKILLDHIDAVLAKHGPPLLEFGRSAPTGRRGAQIKSRTKRNRLGSWAP